MRFTIYPWDFRSWRSAFRVAGVPGVALFFLLLGAMLQVAGDVGGGAGHSSTGSMLFIRAPAVVLAFLLLLFRPRIASVQVTDLRFAYAAFASLYVLSALWSAHPVETIGKGAELLMAGLVFFEASQGDNAISQVEALRRICLLTMSTLGAITVLGFIAHVPAFIQQRPGLISSTTAQSPFLSGNGLGYVASALVLVVFAEWQARRLSGSAAFGQLVFAVALFSVSASRTALGILLLSVLLVVFKKSKILGALAVCSVVVGMILFWNEVFVFLQQHSARSSNIATLSGRTVVWAAAVRQFGLHPILGVGGGIGGKEVVSHISNIYLEELSSLHNGFLEVLTGLGLVGFLIGSSMLIVTTWRTWKAWDSNPEYAGTYVLIIHAWMTTTMSTGILGWMGYEVALFLCILTNVDLIGERARALEDAEATPVRWSAQAMVPRDQTVG